MNPITHFLVSWTVAEAMPLPRARDRMLVSLAGVVPDLDGVGMIVEIATRNAERPLYWWSQYHHVLCHNLGFGLLVGCGAFGLATRRWRVALLSFVSFHLHLLGDLVGGRGPDGSQWPIPYLQPFSATPELVWSGQWELNAWPNVLTTVLLLAVTLYWAWRRGYSPLGLVSRRADKRFVDTLRRRFPRR